MSAAIIEAVSRTVKTMADGTLRLTVDISPIHAQDAFSMFGKPDAPVVLARLTRQAAQASAQAETISKDRVTGLALLAVEWCKDPEFLEWMKSETSYIAESESDARLAILDICDIQSRRELETDRRAIAVFNQEIRGPYMKWMSLND